MLATPSLLLPPKELTALFQRLAQEWHHATDPLSDTTKAAMHPAYQRIIGLGPQAIPLILQELRTKGGHWFWALRAISGENPVTPQIAGQMQLMKDAWIVWAKQKGYIE